MSIRQNQVAWIRGPFEASTHDITIFRGELLGQIPEGKLVIGDSGYQGEDVVAVANEFDSDDLKRFKRRARARQESFNGRLKVFRILLGTYRHSLEKHPIVVTALAVIVQFDMENGNPLFEV